MFPEYVDLICRLKSSDRQFQRMFNKHRELDQKIKNLESGLEQATHEEIEVLKKKKLSYKDRIYDQLRKARAASAIEKDA